MSPILVASCSPACTYQNTATTPCKLCSTDPTIGAEGAYRTGDASPSNNKCRKVPAGFKLKAGSESEVELCPAGSVSYWWVGVWLGGPNAPGSFSGSLIFLLWAAQLWPSVNCSSTAPLQESCSQRQHPRPQRRPRKLCGVQCAGC